jgi:membrane protein DedA with SNARE-associated domain
VPRVRPLPLIAAGLLLVGAVAVRRRVSAKQRALLVLAAAASATAGTGVVELPDLEQVTRRFGSTLGPYTYVLVGAMAFLETGGAVGLIAPGELVVILGGVAAGQGEVELVPLIAIVWGCAAAGDITSYFLGRRLGRGFLLAHGHRVKLTPARLHKVERYFATHGGKTIIAGRFVGVVRSLAPAVAGASGMPAGRFIPATVLGAGLWAAACSTLGYLFWASIDDAIALAKEGTIAIAAFAALTLAVVLVVRRGQARDAT